MKTSIVASGIAAFLAAASPTLASTIASSSVSFAFAPVGVQSVDLLVDAFDVLLDTSDDRSGDGSAVAMASSGSPFDATISSMSSAGTGTGDASATADAFVSFENIGADPITVSYEVSYSLMAEAISDGEAGNDVFSLATLGIRGLQDFDEKLNFDISALGSQTLSDILRLDFDLEAGGFAEFNIFSEASTFAISDTAAAPAPVPLPASGLLLLAGLGGICGLFKRRMAS